MEKVVDQRKSSFQAFNPALFTLLVSIFLVTLLSGGLTIFALVPTAGDPPPFLVAYGSMSLPWILSVAGIVTFSWLASGFARRRWLQIILCSAVFLSSTWLLGLVALSALLAGLKH
ncbi:MAG: hypothetical protein QNJ14_15875 [Woeseiaceae bacterium]|nr:hypothetical protein [Woeseiaceae bacterium]